MSIEKKYSEEEIRTKDIICINAPSVARQRKKEYKTIQQED